MAGCNTVNNEDKLIRETFENYKSAILSDKGEEAFNYVDSRTLDYYTKIIDLVKKADKTEIEGLSLMDKMMVLSIRHRAPKEAIVSFDGKGLFVYAIEQGMVGKDSVMNNEIGEVSVQGDFAKGQLLVNKTASPLYFHFYKQDGNWKVDLSSIFPDANLALQQIIKDTGLSEEDYIFSSLETLTSKKPGEEIWEKIE